MAFNLTRAAGTIAAGLFAKARAGTVRRKLVNIPARIASSPRRIRLRLPEVWPWRASWEQLFAAVHAPPLQHRKPRPAGPTGPRTGPNVEHSGSEAGHSDLPKARNRADPESAPEPDPDRWIKA
jgi:hypothetical protein